MRRRIVIIVAGLLLMTACIEQVEGTGPAGGSESGDGTEKPKRTAFDSARYCTLVVNECQLLVGTINSCVAVHDLVRVSSECTERLAKATCNDILDVNTLCFPPCSTSASACNGDDTLTTCNDGLTLTISCADGCHSNGAKYSGTCGPKNPRTGEVSEAAKCWCE